MKFIFIFLVCSTHLFAEDFTFDKESGQALPNFVAQLKVAKGKVFKSTAGNKVEVKVGTRFYKDDTIITNPDSFAQILIVDDTVMTLGSKSELNFADFKFVDKTNRQIVFSFIKGQIRGLIKNKAKEGDILVKTKLAVMGIRGTEILVNHQTIKNLEISEFALLSGSAQVKDDKNQNHDLSKTDRIVVIQNSNTKESTKNINKLSEAELNIFGDKNQFMNLFELTNLDQQANHAPSVGDIKNNSDSNSDDGEKKDWRNNLKKLNEKLKEYNSPSN